jgi:hypothetical protein
MACVSSSRHHGPSMNNEESSHMTMSRADGQELLLPATSSNELMRTPSSMQQQRAMRYSYPNDALDTHHQHYAGPFLAAKSPISMSFATIIGAGTYLLPLGFARMIGCPKWTYTLHHPCTHLSQLTLWISKRRFFEINSHK